MDTQNNSAFKSWFGLSKVVNDSTGAPLIVHHGTAIDGTTFNTRPGELPKGAFRVFDLELLGRVSDSSDAKAGFWFTADWQRAQNAAVDALDESEDDAKSIYIYDVYLRIEHPYYIDDIRRMFPGLILGIAEEAKRHGYDGIIFRKGEGTGPDYLVFSASQIKSAVKNSGIFDPENDDITE